ncbi:MAG: hypothetical protein ACQER0_08985 [Bacillota bacterium]
MISLSSARKLVEEVRGEELPYMYTNLTLHDWIREGVISRVQVENGNALYPDIIITEILTALKLKDKYSLSEIAQARRCLELEGGNFNEITKDELMRFVNCSKVFNDKKLATKLSLKHIESLDAIKELIDDLVKEKNHLEVVEAYLKEFLKAEKEIKKLKKRKKMRYVS